MTINHITLERWEVECLGHQLRIVTNKLPGDEFGDDIAGLGLANPVNHARARLMAAAPELLRQLDIACHKLQALGIAHQVAEIPELVGIRAAIEQAA